MSPLAWCARTRSCAMPSRGLSSDCVPMGRSTEYTGAAPPRSMVGVQPSGRLCQAAREKSRCYLALTSSLRAPPRYAVPDSRAGGSSRMSATGSKGNSLLAAELRSASQNQERIPHDIAPDIGSHIYHGYVARRWDAGLGEVPPFESGPNVGYG